MITVPTKSRSKEWLSLPKGTQDLLASFQGALPVKLSSIAKALGVAVRSATLPVGISGEIRPSVEVGKFVIKVNRHDDSRRQRFTVAHEIAHFLLHQKYIANGLSDDALYRSTLSDAKEAQANRLAADILMPFHLIEASSENIDSTDESAVSALADIFDVSAVAMKIRLGKV